MSTRGKKFVLGVILLAFAVVAFWGYCFEKEKEPMRIVFNTNGGPVLFEHAKHASPDEYDIACGDCHHGYTAEKKGAFQMSCRQCHYSNDEKFKNTCPDATIHKRCVGNNCLNCHSDGTENCGICHE